jgi:hypothetical protein
LIIYAAIYRRIFYKLSKLLSESFPEKSSSGVANTFDRDHNWVKGFHESASFGNSTPATVK